MFMQAGFAMVETGFTRAKNAAHTMSMNFMVYPIGMIGYWICGFALQMGGVGAVAALGGTPTLTHEFVVNLFGKPFGLFGTAGFFMGADVYDVGIFTLFLFQMVFMDTTVTIPTGAMAERWKWSSFVVYGFFMSMFVYPLFANWVWGAGWLSQLGANFGLGHGHVDFAGSSVVHMVGGVAALAGAMVLGPRLGKFTKDGKPVAIPGHHIPMAIVGTFILAFGWFGFNPGSTLAGTDLRIGVVATNTMLASAGGALAAMVLMMRKFGKPDPSMMANGMLAGLVAITAPCAFVTAPVAVLIGVIAGVLVVYSVFFVEQKLKVDDPVGAISVHGVNGAWGVLSLGLFADGKYGDGWNGVPGTVTGLFYGAPKQFVAQVIGTLVCFVVRLHDVLRVLQGPGRDPRQPRLRRDRDRRPRPARDGRPRLSRVLAHHEPLVGLPGGRELGSEEHESGGAPWPRRAAPLSRQVPRSEPIMTRAARKRRLRTAMFGLAAILGVAVPSFAQQPAPAPTPEATPAPAAPPKVVVGGYVDTTTATTSTRSTPAFARTTCSTTPSR